MAEQDEESLIGYDPLAWLRDEDANSHEPPSLPVEFDVPGLAQADQSLQIDQQAAGAERACQSVGEDASLAVMSPKPRTAIALQPVQTIRNVAELHECLLHALNDSDKVDIDASEVTTIDAATLQLLLVLKQTALGMQKEVIIDFPSERFLEAAGLLGLTELLDVDQVAAGFF